MVLNDWQMRRDRIACPQMWNSWEVPQGATAQQILRHINHVADSATARKLKNLVFHCHGLSAHMQMGAWNIRHDSVEWFKEIEHRAEHIWLVSCQVARVRTPTAQNMAFAMGQPRIQQEAANAGMSTRAYMERRAMNGMHFCHHIARAASAYVTAANVDQVGPEGMDFLPFGQLDDFEGVEMTWDPQGRLIGKHQQAIAALSCR